MQRAVDEDDLKKRKKSGEYKGIPAQKTHSSSPAVPSAQPAQFKSAGALDELEGLIGLDEVKKQFRMTINLVQLGLERDRRGMGHLELTHHLVFTGNPGTGKTTVARIVGRVYKEIGLLKSGQVVEANRSDLIARYIGQTAPKVKSVMARAMDGVLYIDEAYGITPSGGANDFGAEAVATLLAGMEENRDRLVVIAAGYKDEMEKFVNSDPGLKSRFKTIINFEDYNAADLLKIFMHEGAQAGIRLAHDAQIAAAKLMESLERGKKGFGNGRTVRNIFRECLARQAARLSKKSRVDISLFEAEDIPKPGEKDFS